jgi:hypothetical protein
MIIRESRRRRFFFKSILEIIESIGSVRFTILIKIIGILKIDLRVAIIF